MTKQEALKALAKGETLTHDYFSDNEWVKQRADGYYIFEDGVSCNPSLFWADRQGIGFESGWSVFKTIEV